MPRELLAAYPPALGRYDEMLQAPLTPRAHWKRIVDELTETPPEAMRSRLKAVQRQVREDGVTYNVHADPQGADRPWDLDVLPLILPHDEWAAIEAALVQRAQLLDRILDDLYGAQALLKKGLVPPALVYGHAGYLRPCHGIAVPGGARLHLYAADLARAPDGRWWVVHDRTQIPVGAGYALENRLVISRLFADLFRDLKVRRVAGFFAALRDSLMRWAPRDGGAPLAVLLTPGPSADTYFEHAYLARYLGLPLVEGGDLTVREGRVWLKTLSGLERVHAIVRRLDDENCDPLELRSDSALGVAGLLDAVRRGNVLVANALGAGLIESGMLFGFLPRIAEHLLGEPLKMPSVATWWCGEPAALESAVAQLKRLVIKPAFPQLRFDPVFGEDLSAEARAALAERMRARPNDFIAQEMVRLSQAPVWDRQHPRRLIARATQLRVYACATPGGYVVMPGGLARVATGQDARVVSMQRGGGSKDTWVLSTGPVGAFSLLRREIGPRDLVRGSANLSSRVVENLFWFGRYSERCEDLARLLRVALARLIDDTPTDRDPGWPSIEGLLQHLEILPAKEKPTEDMLLRALRTAVVNEASPGLAQSFNLLFGVARQLRERLSIDNWQALNQMGQRLAMRKNRPAVALADLLAELDRAIAALMTLAGFALDGMTRDPAWRFMSLGRRLERLQWLCAVLGQALQGGRDADLNWLLEVSDSSITYRSRYMTRPEWLPVLDLLVCDESNPRSIAFQLRGMRDYLDRLDAQFGSVGDERLADALAALKGIDPARDLAPDSPRLRQLLEDWSAASARLSEALASRFFALVGEVNRQTFAP
ncbi:MAG: circularly permuted type 2 ATP-grasp protein [Betaproteobacteria bacterium]